jgi:hypothetical protein
VTRRATLRAIVTLCLLSLCVPGPTADKAKRYEWLPDPGVNGAAMLSGRTWLGHGPGFTLRLQRLDEAERASYIEKVTGVATDPFATPPGRRPRFVTFLMELENNAEGHLMYRAQQAWLVTSRKEFFTPLGMDTLRATYGMVDREMSPAYARVGEAFVPTDHTLNAGEVLAGLLVYRAPEPGTRRYRLEIQITTPSGDVATVVAPYRRSKIRAE